MPRRRGLGKILVVGPAASGAGGCRALRDEGIEVVVVSADPSAVTTDPGTAARTYVEPLTPEYVARIVERERPDALLATLGGPDALDLAVALSEDGTLARLDVELIGTDAATARRAARVRRVEDAASRRVEDAASRGRQFQLQVLRDRADHVEVVSVTESVDPAGVHPDDSIAVIPAQTSTGEQDACLRDAAVAAVREIGMGAFVAEVQLTLSPGDRRPLVVAVDPFLTRSSAFASRATGVPLARIAARLAIGYTLGELADDLASERRILDRCAVKIPRWAFDELPEADPTLTSHAKSVGEAMAIGRTFKDALQKALRSLGPGAGRLGLGRTVDPRELARLLRVPTPERLRAIADAYRARWSTADLQALTGIDRSFLEHVRDLVAFEDVIAERALSDVAVLRRAKRWGFADARIAELAGCAEDDVRALRRRQGVTPAFQAVGAHGRIRYSTYEKGAWAAPSGRRAVVVLGAGPIGVGEGGESDDGRVQAVAALHDRDVDAVIVDCNPGAVSTDGDTADRVYLEPLTLEDVLNVADQERPLGAIAQLGGRRALALAGPLERAGVRTLGTSPDAIETAGDRGRLGTLLADLGLAQAPGAVARSLGEARAIATRLGYPLILRGAPRCRRVVHDDEDLKRAIGVSGGEPVAVDKFLDNAIQVDVDALGDGREVFVAGVMEHIEKAGIHSADAACALPPFSLGPEEVERVHDHTVAIARALGIVGLVNVRFALKNDAVYVLGVEPGASRTVPFVSRATDVPLARLAARVMLGDPLPAVEPRRPGLVAVREAVFPFRRLGDVDVVLGPETKSIGAVMGLDADFRRAYLKSQLAAGAHLPTAGTVWISVRSCDRRPLVMLAKRLAQLGFFLVAAGDTARVLRRHGLAIETLPPDEHARAVDLMRAGRIALAIDVPEDGRDGARSAPARREALRQNIPHYTTLDGAQAVIGALEVLLKDDPKVLALQDDPAPVHLRAA